MRFIKTTALKLLGAVLLLAGVWVGLMMHYGREPWQQGVVAKYGGIIVAWMIGGSGLALLGYRFDGVRSTDESGKERK